MPTWKSMAVQVRKSRNHTGYQKRTRPHRALAVLLCGMFTLSGTAALQAQERKSPSITRPVRTWEFLSAVGRRAGIFGNESGNVEAWVYPLKLLRDFSLKIHTDGHEIPAASLARTITVRPEAVTILYAGDTFSIRETFFVPVDESGAVIHFDVETEHPLEIEATFRRDFQLEWPAAVGGTYSDWDANLNAFVFGEESRKFAGLAGSPTAVVTASEFDTNYAASQNNGFRLGVTPAGRDSKLIAIAGSVHGRGEAEATYKKLVANYDALREAAADYYADYLRKTVSVELPDTEIQEAYDWSRVSVLQGLVVNPTLGTGLVAGYRTSGDSARPGFAWFFGRDAYWTSMALNSEGDFETTRQALKFLIQFQRADGKIPHEIAQGASFVNWFKDYPYGFASADATPLYLMAMNDYVAASGDVGFAKENWDSLWKAYEFLRSTYDRGFPRNFGVGHGWVEGGPLLPVKTELYQAGLAVEALKSLAALCEKVGKGADAKLIAEEAQKEQRALNDAFWLPERKRYAFALDAGAKPVDELSVLATVPMWFGVLDEEKSQSTIEQLAALDHTADWGMRIISDKASRYSGGGYHYGSVWPLFTGWAAVAEYRYHRAGAAYQNLRANALLALDGSPGHVTEVLSGDYYQPLSTSSPHQIWSAAMVISPVLRGMLGLHTDAGAHTITLAPDLPADWNSFAIRNIAVGAARADVHFRRSDKEISVDVTRTGKGECVMELRPAIGLRADVLGVELNGRPVPYRVEKSDADQHVVVRFALYGGPNQLRIRLRDDFAVSYTGTLPALGHASEGLRILTERWSPARDRLTLELEGVAGHSYDLALRGGNQVNRVEGAELRKQDGSAASARLILKKSGEDATSRATVVFYLPAKSAGGRSTP
ncbi:MAG TPA: hypothetical protein VF758_03675 [Candidatus Acidoferrum sp.]